jgi:hypothetical protein
MDFPNYGLVNKLTQNRINDGLPDLVYHNLQGYDTKQPEYSSLVRNYNPNSLDNQKMIKFNNLVNNLLYTDDTCKHNVSTPSSVNSVFNGQNRLQRYPLVIPNRPGQAASFPETQLSYCANRTALPTLVNPASKEDFYFYNPQPGFTMQSGIFTCVVVLLLLVIFYKVITIQAELSYVLRYAQMKGVSNDDE